MICSLRSSHTESRLLAGGVEAVLAHFATDGQLQSNGSTGTLGRDGLVHADQNLPLHCIIELNCTTSINLH